MQGPSMCCSEAPPRSVVVAWNVVVRNDRCRRVLPNHEARVVVLDNNRDTRRSARERLVIMVGWKKSVTD